LSILGGKGYLTILNDYFINL